LTIGCQKELKAPSIHEIQSCENSVKFWVKDELRENPDLDIEKFEQEIRSTYCGEEDLGYAKILTENGYKTQVEYIKDGYKFEGIYNPGLRKAINWLKDNIPDDAIISSWWDYGHMIRAIAKKNVVIFAPSQEFVDEMKRINPEYNPPPRAEYDISKHKDLVNIAKILISNNTSEATSLMSKYGSKHLLVTTTDNIFSPYFSWLANGNYDQLSENSLFLKALAKDLKDFDLIYSDDYTVVYSVGG